MNRLAIGCATMWIACSSAALAVEPSQADLEKQLDEARERLEQSAREVAELSVKMGGPMMEPATFRVNQQRGIIGAQVDPASGKDGVRIVAVSAGGPAAQAGLKPGDVVVHVDGQDLAGRSDSARTLTEKLRTAAPERPLKIAVLRDKKRLDLEVRPRLIEDAMTSAFIGGMPGSMVMSMPAVASLPPLPPLAPMPPGAVTMPFTPAEPFNFAVAHPFALAAHGGWQTSVGGLELATLSKDLGEYFGAQKGVLVVRAPDNPALKLMDGDVILAVDGREPTSGAHATRILSSYQPGEMVKLSVVRKRKPLTLDVKIADGARPPPGAPPSDPGSD